jgi:hypothetical protein
VSRTSRIKPLIVAQAPKFGRLIVRLLELEDERELQE